MSAPLAPAFGVPVPGERSLAEELLAGTLTLAVPHEVERLRGLPVADLMRLTVEEDLATVIGEHGDDVLYRSRRDGDTARAFAAVARAVAVLLLTSRGGVTIFGLHWCDLTGGGCVDPDCPRVEGGPRRDR